MIRPLQMIPACAVVLLCCTVGTPDDETDESNQQALTNLGANVLVSASPGSPQGNETSATWAIVANSTPGLLVSYNSQAAAPWPEASTAERLGPRATTIPPRSPGTTQARTARFTATAWAIPTLPVRAATPRRGDGSRGPKPGLALGCQLVDDS